LLEDSGRRRERSEDREDKKPRDGGRRRERSEDRLNDRRRRKLPPKRRTIMFRTRSKNPSLNENGYYEFDYFDWLASPPRYVRVLLHGYIDHLPHKPCLISYELKDRLARIAYVVDKARVPVPREDQLQLRKATREQVKFRDKEELQPIGVACELHTRSVGFPFRWHIYPDDFDGAYAERYNEEGVRYNEDQVLVPYSTMEQAVGKREAWHITKETWLEAGQRFPLQGTEYRAATIDDFEPLDEDEIYDEQLEESDVDERRTRERTRARRDRSASVTSREQRDDAQERTARERPSERRNEKKPSQRRRAPLPTPSLSGNESSYD
jgi:hypothetical protein